MQISVRVDRDLRTVAMKSGGRRRDVLRLLKAALDKSRIDTRSQLDEAAGLAVLNSQIKQRLEAARIFAENGATADAVRETLEAALLQEFQPPQLDASAIAVEVDRAIATTGVSEPKQMGKVMGLLKGTTGGPGGHEIGRRASAD